ncbi:hypothetical protein Syun_028283 [Stephania yunnanensis]|uniref:F-box domain-containing protein n=1 Tax=Stephania yunnanensis TaxID=152371 RepID=A0AAP0HQP7_9MAGN
MEDEELIGTKIDHFDRLPDSILLIVFNKIGDVKALGRCCVVSRRFHGLVAQVDNVVVRVDCVVSDDDPSSSSLSRLGSCDKSRSLLSNLVRVLLGSIIKPIQALGQFIGPKKAGSLTAAVGVVEDDGEGSGGVVEEEEEEEEAGELGIDDGVLLKWRADFGSTLDNCVILGASSVIHPTNNVPAVGTNNKGSSIGNGDDNGNSDDNGGIPDSFYTSGGLKLRVVWTISSLIAASARHYLLQPIIAEHPTLDSLVLTDADGQGVLCMNKDQLEELRVKPLSASTASKRTLVPALNMRLWYAPHLELPNGMVLKGATLVGIRPSEVTAGTKKDISDGSWVSTVFDEPYGTAAKLLVKRRTYCLEMNSF